MSRPIMIEEGFLGSSEILDAIYNNGMDGDFIKWASRKLKCKITWEEKAQGYSVTQCERQKVINSGRF